jgi:hypothetical protein
VEFAGEQLKKEGHPKKRLPGSSHVGKGKASPPFLSVPHVKHHPQRSATPKVLFSLTSSSAAATTNLPTALTDFGDCSLFYGAAIYEDINELVSVYFPVCSCCLRSHARKPIIFPTHNPPPPISSLSPTHTTTNTAYQHPSTLFPMAPKKKNAAGKKGNDDWEAEALGEPPAAPADAAPAADEEDAPAGGGGLMNLMRKNKEKRKKKGLSEDFVEGETAADPTDGAVEVEVKAPVEANLDDEFALPDKKGKGKQQPAKKQDEEKKDEEGDGSGKVLTKAEKEKLKKEKEKQRKKEAVSFARDTVRG